MTMPDSRPKATRDRMATRDSRNQRTPFDDLADKVERRSNGAVSRPAYKVPKPGYIPLKPLDDAAVQSGSAAGSTLTHREIADLFAAEVAKHAAGTEGGPAPGLREFVEGAEPGRKRREDGSPTH
jgi:hypothetical protein